ERERDEDAAPCGRGPGGHTVPPHGAGPAPREPGGPGEPVDPRDGPDVRARRRHRTAPEHRRGDRARRRGRPDGREPDRPAEPAPRIRLLDAGSHPPRRPQREPPPGQDVGHLPQALRLRDRERQRSPPGPTEPGYFVSSYTLLRVGLSTVTGKPAALSALSIASGVPAPGGGWSRWW